MKIFTIGFLFLSVALSPGSGIAMSKAPEKSATRAETINNKQLYTWNDGGKIYAATIDPELVVQFDHRDGVDVRAMDTGATSKSTYGNVQIWKLSKADTQISKKLVMQGGKYSPLFKDTNGSMRALPGGYVIALDLTISDAEAGDWFAEQGINDYKKLGFGQNLYKVPTESGLTALKQANAMQDQPGVRFATPDWWRPHVKK
jgi:hypothetical protein